MSTQKHFNIIALVSEKNAAVIQEAVTIIGACDFRMLECSEAHIESIGKDCAPDLIIMEPKLVPPACIESIAFLKIMYTCEIVLLLGEQDITTDVELMRIGAYDSLSNKATQAEFETLIHAVMEKKELELENKAIVETLGQWRAQTIISHSPEMEKVLSMAVRAAHSESTVLITGESGTGKELIARAIHLASPRRHKAFVPINIAALPESFIESELFGHVKGVFAGALADRLGRFALADGGTLFIDEIGDIPSGIQVKLLRVLQFGSYERVGENTPKSSNVRIIAATNKDLGAEIKAGRFRADLYYRVNVVPLSLPALRDHREDIPYLVEYFIKKYSNKNEKTLKGIAIEAVARIMKYNFPGNVRELENIIERGVVLCRGDYLTETDIFLPEEAEVQNDQADAKGTYEDVMNSFERNFLSAVLARNSDNKSAAARELSINERRLRYRLKALGLD